MKIIDVLGRIDSLSPNAYSREEKTKWLSELDGKVKTEILDGYEGSSGEAFTPYGKDTPLDTVLLVGDPYDDIYLRWLEAQISYQEGELERYNEAITLFNMGWAAFRNYYNRTHMPKGQKIRYF